MHCSLEQKHTAEDGGPFNTALRPGWEAAQDLPLSLAAHVSKQLWTFLDRARGLLGYVAPSPDRFFFSPLHFKPGSRKIQEKQ